jgi:hypothetical protein
MKASIRAICALILMVLATGVTAKAQTQILLGASTSGDVSFAPTGSGNVNMQFVSVQGAATGEGGLASISGTYSFTDASPSGVGLTLVSSTPPSALYDATGTIDFSITSGANLLLQGNMDLIDVDQVFSNLYTDSSVVGNVTITGGSDANLFLTSEAGTSGLTINLGGGVFLPTLSSSTTGSISNGFIDPTPEPASMLLFGTGLLAVAGILRRKRVPR